MMDAPTKKTFLLFPSTIHIVVVVVVASSFVTRMECAPIRTALTRVGFELRPIACDKDGMVTVKEEGIPMCKCRDGHFLETRNKHDPGGTARCAKCADCSNSRYRPIEVQKCGSYSDTVCCEHSHHTAEMSEHGYFDCVEPPEPERTTPPEYYPGNSDPQRRNCDTGFYFHTENGTVTSVGADECIACTVCAELKNTPYEKRPCSNTSNTVCCPTTQSTVGETDSGFECSPTSPGEASKTNTIPLSPSTNVTSLRHCDEDDMQAVLRHGRMTCLCNDGTNARQKDNGGYSCESTWWGGDVEPKDKEKMPRLVAMCVIITAMVLGIFLICRLQEKGVLGRSFSNITQLNKQKKKERALEAERAMLPPVNVQTERETAL